MLELIYILILIINIIGYICYTKTNKVVEYGSELFIALFIATTRYVSGSYIAADQVRYRATYGNIKALGNYAIGFKAINYVGNLFNLSFDTFYIIVTIICTIAIFHAVRKMNCNIYIISIIFLLYYIVVSVDLLKNYIAFAILLNVFPCLLTNEKRDIKKYAIGVMIASTFHISFLVFFVLLLSKFNIKQFKTSKTWKIVAVIVLGGVVLILVGNGQRIISAMINQVLSLIIKNKDILRRYSVYTGRTTHLSALAPLTIFTVMLLGLSIWKKRVMYDEKNKKIYNDIFILYNTFLTSSILLPLVLTSAELFRVIRDVTIIGILYIGETTHRTTVRNRMTNLLFVIVTVMGWFIFDIVIKGQWSNFREYFFNIQQFTW